MSQYGCYTFDRLFCECGTCEACQHRALLAEEAKTKVFKEKVGKAIESFHHRVSSGTYVSPEQKREKAKKRREDELLKEYHKHPDLFS